MAELVRHDAAISITIAICPVTVNVDRVLFFVENEDSLFFVRVKKRPVFAENVELSCYYYANYNNKRSDSFESKR